ncbi:MAG: sigma-70 family RNA polymerase sigma factor [Phycisphaerae bacterium]|jgi:RNA polymerase sigma-70 factor (ECF subfamily)
MSDSNQGNECVAGGSDGADDHELMRRTAAGDHAAFAALVRRHQARVLALAYRLLGRWDAAEDVGAEAFVRVYERARNYEPQAQFTTWLYRIVANLCWDQRRRWSRAPAPLPEREDAGGKPADAIERDETRQAVRRAVASLPDRQRLVILLHRFEGLDHREIADITGWSASAVESCLVRAYARLRELLSCEKSK